MLSWSLSFSDILSFYYSPVSFFCFHLFLVLILYHSLIMSLYHNFMWYLRKNLLNSCATQCPVFSFLSCLFSCLISTFSFYSFTCLQYSIPFIAVCPSLSLSLSESSVSLWGVKVICWHFDLRNIDQRPAWLMDGQCLKSIKPVLVKIHNFSHLLL